ncbi:MAG: helicase-related protein [Nannocystaceae bacterium]
MHPSPSTQYQGEVMPPIPGPPLPIDAIADQVVRALAPVGASLVIEAPPGAGKTTHLPIALLGAGLADAGEILILQPRRLAARMAAARVAELLGEPVGERVGYQVRFESAVGPRTRIRFLTEGLLTRRLHGDPELRGVSMVILDEFHERSQDCDLAIALLRRLQRGARPDLRLVVMSATLDQGPVAAYLGCESLRSEGRAFPVEIEYAGDDGELPSRVLRSFHGLVSAGVDGDTLVFLPGAREIRACAAACAPLCDRHGLLLVALHGDLPPADQDRAVRPADRPKLILSTNVAETSVTIDGVTTVIDSGLARIATHNPWSGIGSLQVAKIARASAIQRAGRAGRTRAGRCVRLYSRFDFERRPAFTPPEIARLDLAGALLDLHAAGAGDPRSFEWFEAPPIAAIEAAEALLRRLGAVDEDARLSATGRAMTRFPTHPRLARLLVEGDRRGVAYLSAGTAAILGERALRRDQRPAKIDADADVLVELHDLEQFERQGPAAAERLGLSEGACRQALRARDHLLRLLEGARRREAEGARGGGRGGPAEAGREGAREPGRGRPRRGDPATRAADEEALRLALLAAYPDRVAQAQGDLKHRTLLLAGGARPARATPRWSAPRPGSSPWRSRTAATSAAPASPRSAAPPRSSPSGSSSSSPSRSRPATSWSSTPRASAWRAAPSSATSASASIARRSAASPRPPPRCSVRLPCPQGQVASSPTRAPSPSSTAAPPSSPGSSPASQ